MTSRTDFSVNFELSPRVINITTASTEVTVQDSHDTLTDIQDSTEGGQFPFLVSTTGGEPLDGGVAVGLTTVLRNAQYAFQSTSPRSTGTITTPSAASLIDSGATFIADGVQRGDWIINFSDQSVTEILTVTSQTQLLTRGLRDGSLNTFTNLDNYKVWEVSAAELSGGNFTAVDDIGAGIDPNFPVFGRTFTKTASSSATTQSQAQLEHGTFDGGVSYDPTSPFAVSGTAFPAGTPSSPGMFMSDVHAIADERGFSKIYLRSNTTLTSEDFSDSHVFIGDNAQAVTLTIEPGANVANCEFQNLTLTGTLDGNNIVRESAILTLNYVQGFIFQCAIAAKITIAAGSQATVMDCFSGVAGGGFGQTPEIDCGGSGLLALRNYSGGINLSNYTGLGAISMDMASGRVIVESTVTAGEDIFIRGIADVTDSSVGLPVNDLTQNKILKEIHGQVTRFIHIDTELLINGDGNQQTPFNNFTDAVDFMEANGLRHMVVLSDATVDRQLKNFTILGVGVPSIDLNNQIMDNTIFERCRVTGSYTGEIEATECAIVSLSNMAGTFLTCSMAGTMTVAPNSNLLISRVAPAVAAQPWTLSMNSGFASIAAIHNSSGGVIVTNMDNAGDVLHFNGSQGEITIGATNTNGNMVCTGVVKIDDALSGGTVIDKTRIVSSLVLGVDQFP